MRLRPLLAALLLCVLPGLAVGQSARFTDTDSPVSPAGVRAIIEPPADLHIKNVGGSDGAGLCVFTSIQLAGRWAVVPEIEGFQAYMTKRPGGGYPQKVEKVMADFQREKGVTIPWVQHTGGDVAFLELCYRTRRSPAVTYDGRDNFYRGSVAHMVTGAHLDSQSACIIDNNRPGKWTWMSREDFLSRWKAKGGGWAVVLLGPPPPPNPDGATPIPPGPSPAPNPSPSPPRRPCPGPGPCPGDTLVGGSHCRHCDCAPCVCGWEWKGPNVEGGWHLYRGGAFVGYWCSSGWHPHTSGGKVTTAPQAGPPIDPPLTGVEAGKWAADGRFHYWVNGVEVDRATAFAAVEATGPDAQAIPDDSARWHLSHVGPAAEGAAFLAATRGNQKLTPYLDRLHLRTFDPGSWVARKIKPGVTLQKPGAEGGKVVWHGPPDPAAVEDAVLSAFDPNHRPLPTPIPGPAPRPGPLPTPSPAPTRDVPGPLAAVLAVAYLLTRKDQTNG